MTLPWRINQEFKQNLKDGHKPKLFKSYDYPDKKVMVYKYTDDLQHAYNRTLVKQDVQVTSKLKENSLISSDSDSDFFHSSNNLRLRRDDQPNQNPPNPQKLRNDNNLDPMSKNYKLPPKKILSANQKSAKRKPNGYYINPFSTHRKSSSLTAQSWRRSLPLKLAKMIEGHEYCSKMMETYGYLKLPEDITEENYGNIENYKIDFF